MYNVVTYKRLVIHEDVPNEDAYSDFCFFTAFAYAESHRSSRNGTTFALSKTLILFTYGCTAACNALASS